MQSQDEMDGQLQTRWQHSDWDLERIRLSMVLQNCADQLAVLGHIARIDTVLDDSEENEELWEMLSGARVGEEPSPAEEAREKRWAMVERRHALDNKPLPPDNLEKVEHDRQFLERVVKATLEELRRAGTFGCLLAAVAEEERQKAERLDIVRREEEGRGRARALQGQLQEARQHRAREVHRREEITAHLRSQLQEMRAKVAMERDYMRGISHLKVQQSQEHSLHGERELAAGAERLRERLAEERFIHEEAVGFLGAVQAQMEDRLERWMEAYEADMEAKQKEVDAEKSGRARAAERRQELRAELERRAASPEEARQEEAQEEEEEEVEQEEEEEKVEEMVTTPQEEPQDE